MSIASISLGAVSQPSAGAASLSLSLTISSGSIVVPNNLSIVPDRGYRGCTLDGGGSQGNMIQLWYPPSELSSFELWGFKIANWKTGALSGGVAPIIMAGNINGARIVGNLFKDNGDPNGSLDHDIYLAGGLTYETAARNVTITHNSFENAQNQGYRIKVGSGGDGTAGPDGTQNPGPASHDLTIRYNCFDLIGWGALLVAGEYEAGKPANSSFSDNIVRCDSDSLKEYDGTPEPGNYGGPVYFTWNRSPYRGCDSTFVVDSNSIQVTSTWAADWHVIYNLAAPAAVTQSNPHAPTVTNNVLSHLGVSGRLLAGIPTGSTTEDDDFSDLCCDTLLVGGSPPPPPPPGPPPPPPPPPTPTPPPAGGGPVPSISTTAFPVGVVGTAMSVQLTISYSEADTPTVVGYSMPPGLSVDSSGLITGTPTMSGTFEGIFAATGVNGTGPVRRLPMTVNSQPVEGTTGSAWSPYIGQRLRS